MEANEIAARTSWGILTDPGDRLAYLWCQQWGPTEALQKLRSKDSLRHIALELQRSIDTDESLGPHIAQWRERDSLDATSRSLVMQSDLGIKLMSSSDSEWPAGLADLGEHQPMTLWVLGDRQVLAAPRSWVAVVGSRRASPAGISATRALVGTEALRGLGIVSGGATGIDTAAHRAALDGEHPTIAVLAGGLDSLYPAENRGLFRQISEAGVLLTEAPCGVRSLPERFLHRNRLIAALATVVVVIEAAHRSGAVNTAHHAAALGREVAIVPGRWSDPLSAGCWRLVREQSATVLSEPADIGLCVALGLSAGL
jgi:DNA processing protein